MRAVLARAAGEIARRRSFLLGGVLDQVVLSAFNFLLIVVVAHTTSAAEFGEFTVVWLITYLVRSIHTAIAISPSMTLRAKLTGGRTPSYDGVVFTHSLSVATAVALVGAAAGLAYAYVTDMQTSPAVFAGALLLSLAYCIYDFIRSRLILLNRPLQVLGTDIALSVLTLGGIGAVTLLRGPLLVEMVLWTLTFACAVTVVLNFKLLPPLMARSRGMHRYVLKFHGPFARDMALSATIAAANATQSVFVVGLASGVVQAGGLRAALSLSNLANVIIMAIDAWLPPILARARPSERLPIGRAIAIAAVASVVITGPLVLLLIWQGPAILGLLFGSAYQAFSTTAVVLVLARSVSVVAVVGNAYLRTERMTAWLVRAEAANFVVQAAAVYPLVSLMGAPGAAIAILAGNATALLTTLYAGFRSPRPAQAAVGVP